MSPDISTHIARSYFIGMKWQEREKLIKDEAKERERRNNKKRQ